MKISIPAALLAGFVILSGCASQPAPAPEAGPVFTEAEKAAMTEEEKLAIYNAQVREEDRLRCERLKRVGTRLGSRVCSTAAEREAERENAREIMQDTRRFPASGGE